MQADVRPVMTRNVHATLPGQTDERIVLITHTDGNTWVQENGTAARLAIAHYVASLPIEQRRRTVELHVYLGPSAHLTRGVAPLLAQLDREYEEGDDPFVRHRASGSRDLNPVPRADDPFARSC